MFILIYQIESMLWDFPTSRLKQLLTQKMELNIELFKEIGREQSHLLNLIEFLLGLAEKIMIAYWKGHEFLSKLDYLAILPLVAG